MPITSLLSKVKTCDIELAELDNEDISIQDNVESQNATSCKRDCVPEATKDFLNTIPEEDRGIVKETLSVFLERIKSFKPITHEEISTIKELFSKTRYFRVADEEVHGNRYILKVGIITCETSKVLFNLVCYYKEYIFFQYVWNNVKYSQYVCNILGDIYSKLDFDVPEATHQIDSEKVSITKLGNDVEIKGKLFALTTLIKFESLTGQVQNGKVKIKKTLQSTKISYVDMSVESPYTKESLKDTIKNGIIRLFDVCKNDLYSYKYLYDGEGLTLTEAFDDAGITHPICIDVPQVTHPLCIDHVRCKKISSLSTSRVKVKIIKLSLVYKYTHVSLSIHFLEGRCLYSFTSSDLDIEIVTVEPMNKVISNTLGAFDLLIAYKFQSPCTLQAILSLNTSFISISFLNIIRKQVYYKGELVLDTLCKTKECDKLTKDSCGNSSTLLSLIHSCYYKSEICCKKESNQKCGRNETDSRGKAAISSKETEQGIIINKLTSNIIEELRLPLFEEEAFSRYITSKKYSGQTYIYAKNKGEKCVTFDMENRVTNISVVKVLTDSLYISLKTFVTHSNEEKLLNSEDIVSVERFSDKYIIKQNYTFNRDTTREVFDSAVEFDVKLQKQTSLKFTRTIEKEECITYYVKVVNDKVVSSFGIEDSNNEFIQKITANMMHLIERMQCSCICPDLNQYIMLTFKKDNVSINFPFIYTLGNLGSNISVVVEAVKGEKKDTVDRFSIEKQGHLSTIKSIDQRNMAIMISLEDNFTVGSRLGYKIAKITDNEFCLVTLLMPSDAKIVFDTQGDKYRTDRALVLDINKIRVKNGQYFVKEDINSSLCKICMKEKVTHSATPCNHTACIECWMEKNKKNNLRCHICDTVMTGIKEIVVEESNKENPVKMKEYSKIKKAFSCVYACDFTYILGSYVNIHDFDLNQNASCAPGIHYQTTVQDAMKWLNRLSIQGSSKVNVCNYKVTTDFGKHVDPLHSGEEVEDNAESPQKKVNASSSMKNDDIELPNDLDFSNHTAPLPTSTFEGKGKDEIKPLIHIPEFSQQVVEGGKTSSNIPNKVPKFKKLHVSKIPSVKPYKLEDIVFPEVPILLINDTGEEHSENDGLFDTLGDIQMNMFPTVPTQRLFQAKQSTILLDPIHRKNDGELSDDDYVIPGSKISKTAI